MHDRFLLYCSNSKLDKAYRTVSDFSQEGILLDEGAYALYLKVGLMPGGYYVRSRGETYREPRSTTTFRLMAVFREGQTMINRPYMWNICYKFAFNFFHYYLTTVEVLDCTIKVCQTNIHSSGSIRHLFRLDTVRHDMRCEDFKGVQTPTTSRLTSNTPCKQT